MTGHLSPISRIETCEVVERLETVIPQALRDRTSQVEVVRPRCFRRTSQALKDLIVFKRRTIRRANKTQQDEDKREATRFKLQEELQKYKDKQWKNIVEGIDSQEPDLWNFQKTLRQDSPIPSLD